MLINPYGQYHASEIDPLSELGYSQALVMAGLGYQSVYGDCFVDAPSWIHLQNRLKWGAWNDIKGKGISKSEAQIQWNQMIIKMMKENGHQQYLADPQKPFYEKAYQECVDRMVSQGKSIQEIETNANELAVQQA